MMASRAERQVLVLAQQLAFQNQVRGIEAVHRFIHADLLEWARWGAERLPGCPPEYEVPSVWSLPGDTDPNRDPEAAPEPPEPPINEKRAVELDERIHAIDFPALWRRMAFVNYVWRPEEWSRPTLMRWRRLKIDSMREDTYLEQLHLMLEALE